MGQATFFDLGVMPYLRECYKDERQENMRRCSSPESGHRMREELLLDISHRQVVFTVPKMLRLFFRYKRALLSPLSLAAVQALLTSSEEASVMEVERRAGVIRLRMIYNRIGGRIIVLKQGSFLRPGWRERYESRGSRTVLREAGVKFPGLLTFFYSPHLSLEKQNKKDWKYKNKGKHKYGNSRSKMNHRVTESH